MEHYAQKILKLLNIEDKIKFCETDNNTSFEIICNEVELLKRNDFKKYFEQQLNLHRIYKDDKSELPEFRLKHEIIFRSMVDLYEEFSRLEYNSRCDK